LFLRYFYKNNSSQINTETQAQQENQKPEIDPKIQEQLNELDALKKQQENTQPLSQEQTLSQKQEEIQKQVDELDALHKRTIRNKSL